jgi:phosphatidate cytidylyltransferase
LRSSLVRRLLSAVVLVPILLVAVWMGGWPFVALVLVTGTLATWEYLQMLQALGLRPMFFFPIALLWLLITYFALGDRGFLQPILALLLLVSLSWHVFADQTQHRVENWLLPLAGALYLGWMVGHALLIRALPGGTLRLVATLGIVWSADTAAYLVGTAWGRHHMLPRISPRKTWEGYAAQMVSGTLAGLLIIGLGGLGWGHGAVLGLLLAALTPIGDLGISMIKRQAGVKDSGRLIPGHGGVLDRMDTLLVAVVMSYYYQIWAMGVP